MRKKPLYMVAASILLCGILVVTGVRTHAYADGITHDPLSSSDLTVMANELMSVKPHSGNEPVVSEQQALKAASSFISSFPGEGINIRLVDFSRSGPANMLNVPCYIITIKNTHVPHSQGSAHSVVSTASENPVDLQIVVNATSGQVLFAFAHGHD